MPPPGLFLHGSTIAINTILERTGARTALIITEGFRDIYEIGRINRPDAYNLFFRKHEPLVERALRFEVKERMLADGEIDIALDEDEIVALGARLAALGIEAVAILFLHCYRNPDHEERAKAPHREAKHPGMFVSASHELSQEYREFERCSTVVANAYIGPKVRRYIGEIDRHIRGRRLRRLVPDRAVDRRAYEAEQAQVPLHPHAGVRSRGGRHRHAGAVPHARLDNAIAFDMGGTTAKAGVIYEGEPLTTGCGADRRLRAGAAGPDRDDGHLRGRHRRRLDRARRRRARCASVRKAPAPQPGPACYGLGGSRADRHRCQSGARAASAPTAFSAAR